MMAHRQSPRRPQSHTNDDASAAPGGRRPIVWAGVAAAFAVLVSALVAASATGAVPPQFSAPVTLGRWLNNGSVLRATDLSGDGIPDVVSADADGGDTQLVSIWLGRGDGSFGVRRAYRTAGEVIDMDIRDINRDHKPDLIVAGALGPVTILVNRGGGRFRRDRVLRSGPPAWDVAASDLNHDRRVDVVIGGDGRRNIGVLLRRRDGSFATARRFHAVSGELGASEIEVGDINGDRNVDLAVLGTDRVAILLGNGKGAFGPARSIGRFRDPSDLQLADVNLDGKLDLILGNTSAEEETTASRSSSATATARSRARCGHTLTGSRSASASPTLTATPIPMSPPAASC